MSPALEPTQPSFDMAFNSASTRRQVGITKKRILHLCEMVKQVLDDYDIDESEPQFDHLKNEELLDFRADLGDQRSQLHSAYTKMRKLDEEWSTARSTDTREEEVFNEYVKKYGDYSTTVQTAVDLLETIDDVLNAYDKEVIQRKLPLPPENEEVAPSTHSHSTRREYSHNTADTSMNFVDASILSRLELPIFDGNLLDYPEFMARFSTLIGNKRDLDDATKFSLLKSCLRGRALQSIHGLALTAQNYSIALDILKTRYDDKVTTRHILFTQLANLPACDEQGKHLQSLYNKMYSLTRQFCSYEDDTKEIALGAILLNKLPRDVRSMVYDKAGQSHNLTPSELLQILTNIVHKEATLQEIEYHSKGPDRYEDTYFVSHTSRKRPIPSLQKKFQPVVNAARNENIRRSRQKIRSCSFCESKEHSTFNCSVWPTAQQRIQVIKEKKLCFNCLSPKHRTKECPSTRTCQHCSKRHHTSICLQNRQAPQQMFQQSRQSDDRGSNTRSKEPLQMHFAEEGSPNTDQRRPLPVSHEQSDIVAVVQNTPPTKEHVLLMCANVDVFNPETPEQRITTMAFFDSGSTRSYITNELAKDLHLPQGQMEEVSIYTFAAGSPFPLLTTLHSIGVSTNKGCQILCVNAIENLTKALKIAQRDPHNSSNIVSVKKQPSILIGADYFWDVLFFDEFYIQPIHDGYQLVHSSVGDIITGKPLWPSRNMEQCFTVGESQEDSLSQLVQKLWSHDSEDQQDSYSEEDRKCLEIFKETIYFDETEGRYVVQLPFKRNKKDLPNNIQLAYARLLHNMRHLKHCPDTLSRYHALIQDQLHKGIIEEVQESKLPKLCHYLPHHAVISEEKRSTKLRCVYDGSAKTKGNPSLNELLYRGPVFLPDLTGILLRLRLPKILISSDIEKAFLMVGLNEESRDFTRFLWLKNPQEPINAENIITYRFRRVPFGLVASPFLLAGTIQYHLQMTDSPLSRKILKNTYVDNIFHGVDTVEEGKLFYESSKHLFQQAGMNLRQFVSNSEELNRFLTEKEDDKMVVENKVLGIAWNTADDTLSIRLPTTPAEGIVWTKRKILKIIASTFDPMGWCAPALFKSKVFLQSLWKENLRWDDTLSEEVANSWKSITAKWNISTISLPRQLVASKLHDSVFQLHVFTDASSMGYCAVAYLVHKEAQRSSILMSKSRLSPSKKSVSIPRLELSAIALGAQLLKHIRASYADEINLEKSIIWSDSSVALTWIKSGKRLPVFIQNRITTTRENAPDAQLRYVPGDTNPADVGSRGANITDLKSFDLWWKGPAFLCQSEDQWPVDITDDLTTEESCHVQESQIATSPNRNVIIRAEKFSSWTRLLRTMQKVLLFLTKKVRKTKKNFGNSHAFLFKKAKTILFRFAQMQYPPSEEVKRQLGLFYDEQEALWRSKGRISNASLPFETISPIFLPRESHITSLFVLQVHQDNNHSKVNHTLNELRRKVWVPKGRLTVKRVIYTLCFHCKRYKAQPYQLPPFPVHPPQRVRRPNYPFENSGMDYAGPLMCKIYDEAKVKYWILLITCLNTRAIYVDLLLDMSTQTLFQALRRFFATTAYPRWILCDNAKSFRTINELQDCLRPKNHEDDDIIDYCAQRMIEFKFIPSFSPWQGGLYEKMVHIFKTSFKHALNNRVLNIEELRTIAKETETIVNHRPLTYIVEGDRTLPLRPIDFLHPWTSLSPPRVDVENQIFIPTTTTKEQLMEDWKFMNMTLDRFWKRWTTEYLTSLREQFRIRHPHPRSSTTIQPKLNDFVLVQEKSLERGQWKMGQIVSSGDQFQRSANVLLPSRRLITRPINLLHKLEIQGEQQDSQNGRQESSPVEPQNRHPMMTRSKTAANRLPFLISTVLTLMLIHSSRAHPRCPVEINTPKTIIYATNCISEGLAIARHSFHGKVKLCWFPLSCPSGVIRVTIPFQHNKGLCGPRCSCPAWATACSFSSSPRKIASKLQNVPLQLATYHPAHVCSFSSSPECDNEKRLGSFNQVELYDGTLLVVPELHIAIKDYLDSTDYLCFDVNGLQQKAEPPYTGSSYFCDRNKCEDNATLFCTFGTPSAVFTMSNVSFLVKAWGVTVKEYYGHPISSKLGANFAHCSKGGVSLIIRTPTNAAEVCIAGYCHFIQNPTNSTIVFPNSLVVFTYTASVSSWTHGELIQKEDISCHPYPVCELIDCTVCLELLYNPDCWTGTRMALICCLLLALLVTMCMISPFLRILIFIIKLPVKILHLIFKKVCSLFYRRSHSRLPLYRGHRKKILIAILFFVTSARCCSEIVTFSATEEACTQNGERESCTFNQATVMTLQPLEQETCLVMKNNKNIPLGMITIRATGIYFKCQKKIEFYTRDHQFHVESVHRCRLAGSCQMTTCDTTKTTDKIEELSHTANNHPGYTFCTASCGCLTCAGCFLCMDSCLFYRYYALPQSSQIYTIFNCPVWEFTVEAKLTKQQGKKSESTDVRLRPGQTYDWNSVRISLIGTMVPQLPIFGATFVTNGNVTATTKPAFRGQMIPHTIGQLQCANISEAQAFRCNFPSNVCSCATAINHATCSCSNGEVKRIFQSSSLPLIMKNVMIFQKADEVVAKTNIGSAVQMHIIADNMKLVSTRRNTTCVITASDLVGCYDCLSAAYANISCQSLDGEVTAQITCGNQHQMAICTPSGHINKVVFVFYSSVVKENCTLACPGGSTDFTLSGRLHYVEDASVVQEKTVGILPFESSFNFSFALDTSAVFDHSLSYFKQLFSSLFFSKYFLLFWFCVFIVIVAIYSFRTLSLAFIKKII